MTMDIENRSRRKFLRLGAALAGTALVAGCSEDQGDGSTTTDGSSTQSTESETETTTEEPPDLDEFEYPQGATKEGIAPKKIVDNHFSYIESAGSMTLNTETSLTQEGPDGDMYPEESSSIWKMSDQRALVENTRNPLYRDDFKPVTTTRWADRSATPLKGLVKRSNGDETVFQIRTDLPEESNAHGKRAFQVFHGFSFSEAKEVVMVDGTPVARYGLTGVEIKDAAGPLVRGGVGEISKSSGSVYVAESGLLKKFEFEFEMKIPTGDKKRDKSQSSTYTYSDVGETTAESPSWVETAREEGRLFSMEVTDDGFLKFKLENGKPVPKGASLSLYVDDQRTRPEFEFPEQLEVGDEVIVSVEDSGISVAVGEKPSERSSFRSGGIWFRIKGSSIVLFEMTRTRR